MESISDTTTELSDATLLERYLSTGSDEAFAALQRRYSGLVYSVCYRELRDRTLAEDASQGVFLLMIRKAKTLKAAPSLAGWLFTTSLLVSRNLARQERRRIVRENRALAAQDTEDQSDDVWGRVEPQLNNAINRLKAEDREALLLRFFKGQSYGEVAMTLGVTENTARMRVARCLERIRTQFKRLGLELSVLAISSLLDEHATEPCRTRSVRTSSSTHHLSTVLRRTSRMLSFADDLRFWPAALFFAGAIFTTVAVRINSNRAALSERYRAILFRQISGDWTGSIEYADDQTQVHHTYRTTVHVDSVAGDSLTVTAKYVGSTSVDVTKFLFDRKTNDFAIENGGPAKSHVLDGKYQLVAGPSGGAVFEGISAARATFERLIFTSDGNQLTIGETYRRTATEPYRFRNQFTLSRP